MSITALSILNGAFDLIGVKSQGETLSGADAQDGLRRLNNLVRAWQNQSLTIPYVNREVFPLVANQNTYTIGPGGDLETDRPPEVVGAGLLLNAAPITYAITAVSTTLSTFTIAGSHASEFPAGLSFEVTTSTGNDGSYTVASATYAVSTVITVLDPIVSAVADGIINVATATQAVEIQRGILTDDAYQAIAIKDLTNSLFTSVYYNPTFPLGTIYLWPTPDTAIHDLVLYLPKQLSTFADLSNEYNVPPGYEEALEYNVAERLLVPYAVKDAAVIQGVRDMAVRSLATIKRQNTRMSDMRNAFVTDRRTGYNILTGTGG